MKEFNTQYHCTACDGEFDTRGETAIVTRCPYCGDTERLEVTALQSADCEIENIEDTDSSITPEQEEMALYERSVEQLGTQAVSELCIHALANLIDRLIEFRAVIRAEDCTGEDFKEQLSNLYFKMQDCCMKRDVEPIRPYFADALWQQFDRQVKQLKAMHRTNYVERIAVLGTRIVGYHADKVNDNLVIELRTRITDYTVNDATGAVISGSKTAEKFMTYEWTLIRSVDKATGDKEDMSDPHCPNCGAPIAINHSAKCEYCGQVLTVDDYDWTISAIRGISQVTRGN